MAPSHEQIKSIKPNFFFPWTGSEEDSELTLGLPPSLLSSGGLRELGKDLKTIPHNHWWSSLSFEIPLISSFKGIFL